MLRTKDVLELRKRLTKEECTITRMCGCYVDSEKNKVTKLEERFLNLDDEEFYKYLDIVKQVFHKKIHDNMLSMEIEKEVSKKALAAVVSTKLKQEEVLDRMYDSIIENFGYAGNYLILFFHDAYDVMKVTSDNQKLEESEEVYEHIICVICPVTLTKPGIEYNQETNAFESRERDWVVQKPECGFIYPAFEERSAEPDKVLFYTNNTKNPPHKLMEQVLGCEPFLTATEIREIFDAIIRSVTQSIEVTDDYKARISNRIFEIIQEPDAETKILTKEGMEELIKSIDIAPVHAREIAKGYDIEFQPKPQLSFLLNGRALKSYEEKLKKKSMLDLLKKASKEIVAYANEETDTVQEIEDMIKRNS